MEEIKTEEGNKLIAIFSGAEYDNTYNPDFPMFVFKDESFFYPEELKYHSSWDWLMPCLYKAFEVTTEDDRQFAGLVLFELGLFTPLNELHTALVEFIQWYNQQTL